jgi:hypothetical protein
MRFGVSFSLGCGATELEARKHMENIDENRKTYETYGDSYCNLSETQGNHIQSTRVT